MFELKIIGLIGYKREKSFDFGVYEEINAIQGELLYLNKVVYKGAIIIRSYKNTLLEITFFDDFGISDDLCFLLSPEVNGQIKLNNEFFSFHRENYTIEITPDRIFVRNLTFVILY